MRITKFFQSSMATVCVMGCLQPAFLAGQTESNFQDVLSLAGMGPEKLATFSEDGEFDEDQWQLLAQLLHRLQQFPPEQIRQWAAAETTGERLGQLREVSATVESVTPLESPPNLPRQLAFPVIYRCRVQLEGNGGSGWVLVPQIPDHWQDREVSDEPVKFAGIFLGTVADHETPLPQLLTNHLAWHPRAGVPSGWLLLARQGMDVALLDEVRHREPFVKPNVSREGEAFYGCLAALANVEPAQLTRLTLENLHRTADQWRAVVPSAEQRLAELRRQLASTTNPSQRDLLKQELEAARRELALAAAVARQAGRQLSSVAPLFLQPERETGQLVRIEGVARRAVRIATNRLGLDGYYEMEVFPADSQNLPVVCCLSRLPAEFPVGDKIREHVRVDGLFFKSWRYRTRKNLAGSGQTNRQQQMYTPVVVGRAPTWLPSVADRPNPWAAWAGFGFLAALAILWIVMIGLAKRDRQQRAARQSTRFEELNLEN